MLYNTIWSSGGWSSDLVAKICKHDIFPTLIEDTYFPSQWKLYTDSFCAKEQTLFQAFCPAEFFSISPSTRACIAMSLAYNGNSFNFNSFIFYYSKWRKEIV